MNKSHEHRKPQEQQPALFLSKMISKLDAKNTMEATAMNKQQNPYFEQMLVGSQTQYKWTGH